jgi:DNA-binding transcriptional MerR regulator/methylmalonyl-CoA mutase cobalamin-binding subunit
MSATHPIRAVARLTGIPLDTLRAWERRYHAVTPQRSGRGRVYSEKEIQRLMLLRDAVARGHAIGQIARIPEAKLRALLQQEEALVAPPEAPQREEEWPRAALAPLVHAIENFDYIRADRELSRLAAATVNSRELVHQVALPLMRITGERWHQGTFTIAQEHMVTSLLSGLLASMLRMYHLDNPPARVMLGTLENEHHGFGILASAMLTAAGGLGAIYLGTSLPVREIILAARRTGADAVLIGISATPAAPVIPALKEIRERIPARTELWAGGANAQMAGAAPESGWVVLHDFQSLEHRLELLGARF